MGVKASIVDERGQMTVEFVIAFPVMIVVAVIAVNAMLFFGECAAFDRTARDSIRANASSPAYGQGVDQVLASIQSDLDRSFERSDTMATISVEGCSPGFLKYTATLHCIPTLFGHDFGGSVFGVELAPLTHSTFLVIDSYKPGAVI